MQNQDVESNPCLKEHLITFKCFDKYAYDKEQCQLEIENYKNCKTFWHYVKAERKRKGIAPYLPPSEEREEIKKEYLARVKPQS